MVCEVVRRRTVAGTSADERSHLLAQIMKMQATLQQQQQQGQGAVSA